MKIITSEVLLKKLETIKWYEDIRVIVEKLKQLNKGFYFVGGTLRDAIISIIYKVVFDPQDIDIVVEMESHDELVNLVKDLFKEDIEKNNIRLVKYPQFLTLSVIFIYKHIRIDLSLPRKEKYRYYGALPEVDFGKIEDDLFRRDFSINSIALRYDFLKREFYILDPFDGIKDIKNKKIRVLHKKSFLEDPTRIIRAIRLSAKLKFELEKNTVSLIASAIKERVFENVSRVRWVNEFVNILKKGENFEVVVKLFKKFKLLETYSWIKEVIDCFVKNYKKIELKKINSEYKFYIRLFYLLEVLCKKTRFSMMSKNNEKIKKYLVELNIPRSIREEIYKALDVFSGKRRLKEEESWIKLYAKIYKKEIPK